MRFGSGRQHNLSIKSKFELVAFDIVISSHVGTNPLLKCLKTSQERHTNVLAGMSQTKRIIKTTNKP